LREAQSTGIYFCSGRLIEVFRPVRATYCTSGVIYFYFTPIGAALGVGPKKRKILPNFLQNSEYERFAPLYFLHYFYEIFRDCGELDSGPGIKILGDSLKGFQS